MKSSKDIETISKEVSLERLVLLKGVSLKKHGSVLVGTCPFHTSKKPTLEINAKANTWSCSGKCRVKDGTPVTWIQKAEGVSSRHALELLRNDQIGGKNKTVKRSSTRKIEPFLSTNESDEKVLSRVVDFYAETLRSYPEALDYLKQRKLDNQELIQYFKLGYSNRTLGYRLPEKNRASGAALRGQLKRLGIFRASGHEHLSGSLVVPISNAEGTIVDLYGRKITPDLRSGTLQHLNLGKQPKGIFNVGGIHDGEVILCKSILDSMSFWVSGFRNAIPTFGIDGFTNLHRQFLKDSNVKKVIIAFDRTKEGDTAGEKLASDLTREGLQVFRVLFPWNMDANDFLKAGGSFDEVVRAAQWMGGKRETVIPDAINTLPTAKIKPETASEASRKAGKRLPYTESPVDAQAIGASLNEVLMHFGSRTWRIRGHESCTSLAAIKVNVRVSTEHAFFHDTIDLLSARTRASFLKQAREELEIDERILKADLGQVVFRIEELVDSGLRKKLEPKQVIPAMSDHERNEALALLRDPHLVERIVRDFDRCGIVGEEDNKLIGYLASISRRLEEPLAIVIQSSSAAGKSSLLDAILRFIPEEEKVTYSAMTGQSLYYMGGIDLKHKVLAIAEEAGVNQAAYALRVLQSSGELSIASTGKDQATGRLSTHQYLVRGPVAILMTTTAIDVEDELLSRCIVLTVDESQEQTKAIQEEQRRSRTLDGLLATRQRLEVEKLHQNAQRLLVPVMVVNPFAMELTFSTGSTRSRRDQKKLLTLIDAIAYLHQNQRPVKTAEVGISTIKYIEVTKSDIDLAMKLAEQVFPGTEDVPPQTGRMFSMIKTMVTMASKEQAADPNDIRFTRRQLRERFGWGEKQARIHLDRLTELEYVIRHRGSQGQRFIYSVPMPMTETSSGFVATSSTPKDEVFFNGGKDLSKLRPLSKGTYKGNGSGKSGHKRSSLGNR